MKKDMGCFTVSTLLGLVCGFSIAILIQQPIRAAQAAGAQPTVFKEADCSQGNCRAAEQQHVIAATTPASRSFTYQGMLRMNGQTVNGECNFKYSLWDSLSAGTQIGSPQTFTTTVSNGLFTFVPAYSGSTINTTFDGRANWIAISVSCPAGSGTYTDLTPRQPILAAPLASGLVPHTEINAGNSYSGNPLLKLTALPTSYGNPNGLWAITDASPAIGATWTKVGVWGDSTTGLGIRGTTSSGVGVAGDVKGSGVGVKGSIVKDSDPLTSAIAVQGVVDPEETGLAGQFIGNVEIQGKLTSNMSVRQVISSNGPMPITSSSFTTKGGTLLIFVSGSGYGLNPGYVGMTISIDGVAIGTTGIYATAASVHLAFVPKQLVITTITAGTHTLSLTIYNANSRSNANDEFQVTVLEMPY